MISQIRVIMLFSRVILFISVISFLPIVVVSPLPVPEKLPLQINMKDITNAVLNSGKAHGVCHPIPKSTKNNYLIGYGSLINENSKARTAPNTGQNIPVKINGFKRIWNARGFGGITYLGVEHLEEASFNGVVFRVSVNNLTEFDKREELYCREKVPFENIIPLTENWEFSKLKDDFWIYVTQQRYTANPNEQYPIEQSYVDTFVSGCFEIEDKYGLADFAADCVVSTDGWDNDWVNDRNSPRRKVFYPEPEDTFRRVDEILSEIVPEEFNAIQVKRKK